MQEGHRKDNARAATLSPGAWAQSRDDSTKWMRTTSCFHWSLWAIRDAQCSGFTPKLGEPEKKPSNCTVATSLRRVVIQGMG